MELKFKNITKCSKEIYNEFLTFHSKKFGLKEKIQLLFIVFVIAYMIVFNIKFKNITFLAIAVVLLLISFFAYKVYRRETASKKQLKTSKVINKEEVTYKFYNLYMETIYKKKRDRIWYFKLYKVYQDSNNFYFYLDETHALLMDKKSFVVGNLSDFKKFISRRCFFKYKKN